MEDPQRTIQSDHRPGTTPSTNETPLDLRRAKQLFDHCWSMTEDDRAAYLREACAGQSELAAAVTDLLATALREDSPFEPRGEGPAAQGPILDRYVLEECIGKGGMGEVHAARDRVLEGRRVAVKVLRTEVDGDAILQRFAREQQILAAMRHSAIASFLDAGITPDGRPWFAMELVDGEPLTGFCERERLSRDERLRLFQEVCLGVEHAHGLGIVHRDLKPGNLLVARVDGVARPKIIDFGIARAVDLERFAHTVFTQAGHLVGTPDYMSPEQADPLDQDIDVRSDVYSLGVLLFELVAGRLPFESGADAAGYLAALHARTGSDAPPLRSRAPDAPTDLEQICAKALARDRDARYQSARALADDVGRLLRNEPVRAAPPSKWRRSVKWVARNRLFATGAASLLLALVVGVLAGLWAQHQAEGALSEFTAARRAAERIEDPLIADAQLDAAAEAWPRAGSLADNLEWNRQWLATTDALLARLPEHHQTLERLRNGTDELEASRATALATLVGSETSLRRTRDLVAAREAVLRRHDPLWEVCARSLASSPEFTGLDLRPLPGLLPLGIDLDRTLLGPRTDFPLWAFFAPMTGEPPRWLDDAGQPARLGEPGYPAIDDDSAVVVVLVPGGEYWRGAQNTDPSAPGWDPLKGEDRNLIWEEPVLRCRLAPMLIGRTEVTNHQFRTYVELRRIPISPDDRADPDGTRTAARRQLMTDHPRVPVNGLEWNEAREFAQWLGLDLPSETAWEYCCRAGTVTSFWSGSDEAEGRAVGWSHQDAHGSPQRVGSRSAEGRPTPNPWGLHDVHGNVWEWCLDLRRERYDGTHVDGSPADVGTDHGMWRTDRVFRGGGIYSGMRDLRSANRLADRPGRCHLSVGLRLALPLGGSR